jgi:hypothetical protein
MLLTEFGWLQLLWAIVNTMSDEQFRKFMDTLNTEQLKVTATSNRVN